MITIEEERTDEMRCPTGKRESIGGEETKKEENVQEKEEEEEVEEKVKGRDQMT